MKKTRRKIQLTGKYKNKSCKVNLVYDEAKEIMEIKFPKQTISFDILAIGKLTHFFLWDCC